MPLVPQSTVSAWYRNDSFVYKNFRFLFKNPLWSKDMPRGFSLCPYFWLSMFSLCIFRPFVYMFLAAQFVSKKTGLSIVLSKCKKMLFKGCRFANEEDLSPIYVLGIVLIIALCILSSISHSIYVSYAEVHAIPAFILPLSLGLITIGCFIYTVVKGDIGGCTNRCEVEWYSRVSAIICVGLAYWLMPSEFVAVIKDSVDMMKSIVAFFWNCIESIGWGIGWIFTSIYGGIKFLCTKFASIFLSNTVVIISSVGFIVAVLIYSYIAAKFNLFPEKKEEKDDEKIDPIYGLIHNVWLDRRVTCPSSEFIKWAKLYHTPIINDCHAQKIDYSNFYETLITQYEIYWQKHYERERNEAKLRAERAAKRDARCKKVTKALSLAFTPIIMTIKWLWKITKAFFKNFVIFLAYMWELVKARKQGACPYLKFTESNPVEKK